MRQMKLDRFLFLTLFLLVAVGFCSCDSTSNNNNKAVDSSDNSDEKEVVITDASKLSMDKTLDVVTWNLEWFGAPRKSKNASSFDQQLSAVSKRIKDIDADIYAFQELVVDDVNGDYLKKLVDELNTAEDIWEGVYGDKYSYFFKSQSTNYPAQRLCYVYKKSTVNQISSQSMFEDVYSGSDTNSIDAYTGSAKSFWSSGRLPFMMNVEVNIGGEEIDLELVNIHGKCCNGSSSRRKADADFLKRELDAKYDKDNIIVLGDYNDYFDRSMDGGDSPYKSFYSNNNEKFKHVFGQGIDHISISNELYDEFEILTNNTTKYDDSISDHNPQMVRFLIKN
ncbi:MAG: endonuclease/exonuclease/phosphatase family metal-dependent hydrolase [Ancylomarina sp.]|jgi:endonuclease/exonuclease/phosphatase family metal-dependent hydrolase